MKKTVYQHTRFRDTLFRVGMGSMLAAIALASGSDLSSLVEVDKGSASFELTTNMPGIEVKGKSSMLSATAVVQRMADRLILEQIRASFPVESLTTGMKVRDEHMRRYIFIAENGQAPDVVFEGEKSVCTSASSAHQFECDVSGTLTIRGIPRPLTMKLQVKEQNGSSPEYRAAGSGTVRLTLYGIQPPSQFGVKTSDEVKLRLVFTGRQRSLRAFNARASAGPTLPGGLPL